MKDSTLALTLSESVQGIALSSLSPRDKPWEVHRLQASEVAILYGLTDFPQYGERIRQCALRLAFDLVLSEVEEGVFVLKLRAARFCRVRHCPVCQWRRSLMWRARFFQTLPRILRDYPNHRFIFTTFTVKNCKLDELRSTITGMNQGWKRMTERKVWPGRGWVKSLEITRRPDMMCHPHFHALLMVESGYFGRDYLKHEAWVDLWQQSMRIDYKPVVNVKSVKSKLKTDNLSDAVIQGITETIKYTVKPQDLILETDPSGSITDWLNGITEQLANTRAIAVGGVFKDYLSEDEPENLIHAEGEETFVPDDAKQIFCGWRERYSQYLIED